MRRFIHNSTAIVACLSILAPQLAEAQLIGAGAAGRAQEQRPLADTPLILAESGDGGSVIRQNSRRNAEEQRPREERERQRPQRAQEGERGERAERRQQRQRAEDAERGERAERREERQQNQQRQRARANAERPDQPERERRQERPRAAERENDRERPEAVTRQRNDESRFPRAIQDQNRENRPARAERRERQAEERRRDEAQAEERRENREERAERRQQQIEERRRDEAQAEQRRENREERAERRERREQSIEEALRRERNDRPRNGRLGLADSDDARQRGRNMAGLNGVLTEEVDRGLNDSDLRCLSGGSYPCADGDRMVTPRGVVVERRRDGGLMLAEGRDQMFRVAPNGRMIARAAEEGSRETDISRQAARETRASDLAAALFDDRRGQRREERITRENSRSSSQDFATSLRDALSRDDRRRDNRRDDDDDDNDLTKALLLGAGALAVGAMLNNNRQVALSSPDRVVVTRADGSQEVVKDEVALLRQPGSTVTTEEFDDGSSRTIVTREDGSKVVTIRDADLRVLRRTLISADGRSTRLIDDTEAVQPVDIATLPEPAPVYQPNTSLDEQALRDALSREAGVDRRFTLGQVRNIPEVRALVAPVNLDAITFDTGSAAINPDQAKQLSTLGEVIEEAVAANPQEIFMIEGHTDTVGSDVANLALSDRRAESVALALSEYFDVPPENLVVQGYGEQFPQIRAEGDIRENRRASVRRITDLLQSAQAE